MAWVDGNIDPGFGRTQTTLWGYAGSLEAIMFPFYLIPSSFVPRFFFLTGFTY
jgi:hypothetical protein